MTDPSGTMAVCEMTNEWEAEQALARSVAPAHAESQRVAGAGEPSTHPARPLGGTLPSAEVAGGRLAAAIPSSLHEGSRASPAHVPPGRPLVSARQVQPGREAVAQWSNAPPARPATAAGSRRLAEWGVVVFGKPRHRQDLVQAQVSTKVVCRVAAPMTRSRPRGASLSDESTVAVVPAAAAAAAAAAAPTTTKECVGQVGVAVA